MPKTPLTADDIATDLMRRHLRALRRASRDVFANWERGDLAAAVRNLNRAVDDVERELPGVFRKWKPRPPVVASLPKNGALGEHEFRVTWEIDIEAPSPRAAALRALAIQRNNDPANLANVFKVGGCIRRQKASGKWSERYETKTIDLAE